MTVRSKLTVLGTLIAVAGLSLSGASAWAASECKGLEQAACGSKAECNWVEPYTRKDGIKVSGHCRSKGKKSEEAKASGN